MRSGSKSGPSVGLYLGGDTFVSVTVRPERESYRIESVSAADAPPEAMEGTKIGDAAKMAEVTRTLRRQMRLEAKSVSLSLPSPGYGLRTVRLPDVPAREQRIMVRGELEGAGTLPATAGGMDFIWSPLPSTEDKHMADVFAYYANDSTLDPLHQVMKSAGMMMEAIEPASLSMMRGYLAVAGAGRPLALLVPHDKHTDLCLHDGTRVRHIRRIQAGVIDITGGAPQGAVDFTSHGGGSAASSPVPWDRAPADATGSVAAPPIDEEFDLAEDPAERSGLQVSGGASFIVSEINRTLAFHSREHGQDSAPGALVVLADRPMAAAISAQIADALTIPIDSTDAIAEAAWPGPVDDIRPDQLLAALGTSLGSAGFDYGIPMVDVSQQERVAAVRRRAPSLLLAGMAGSTLWMIAAAVGAIALTILESNTSSHLNQVTGEIERIKAEQAPGIKYRDLMNSVQTIQREAQVPAMSVLGRVAASVTPGVSLTSVDVTSDGKVAVGGKAVGYGAVKTFASALGQGKAVILPYIENAKRDQGGLLTFRIVGMGRGVSEEPAETTGVEQ